MSLFDKTTLRILFTVLATAALIALVWLARKPLLVFLFAMLFAYLLEPLIALLQRWTHMSRGFAIATVYVALLAALLTVGMAVGPRVLEEVQHLSEAAPELYNKVASGNIAMQVGQAAGMEPGDSGAVCSSLLWTTAMQVLATISAQSAKLAPNRQQRPLAGADSDPGRVFPEGKEQLCTQYRGTAGQSAQPSAVSDIMSDLDDMLSHFVRAQLYVAAISGGCLSRCTFADASALRLGPWNAGRLHGVHSICRPSGGWSPDSGRRASD